MNPAIHQDTVTLYYHDSLACTAVFYTIPQTTDGLCPACCDPFTGPEPWATFELLTWPPGQ